MRVPDEVRKCVAFVCSKSKTSHEIRPVGTAFFLSIPTSRTGNLFSYVVTAKHVVEGIRQRSEDQIVYLRVNMKSRAPEHIATPIEKWEFHSQDLSADVAVLPGMQLDGVDCLHVPVTMVATSGLFSSAGLGVGDEVFLTGLFVGHSGRSRNIPIVRVGTIAAMPEEPVATKIGDIEAYLVEARSIGGLSGSPVFVHLGPMREDPVTGSYQMLERGQFFLLGLMHGHWKVELAAVGTDDAGEEAVNMGIAIVVPISKVLDIINQPKHAEARRVWEEEMGTISGGAGVGPSR